MTSPFVRYAIPLTLALSFLVGCASKQPAPVVERSGVRDRGAAPAAAPAKPTEVHVVRKGETLYSIALEHGLSYRDVAAWNSIDNPNVIRVGQQLRIVPPEGTAVVKPVAEPSSVEMRPFSEERAPPPGDTVKRDPKGGKHPYTEQAMAAVQKIQETPPPATQTRVEPRPGGPVADGGLSWIWPSGGRVIAAYVEGSSKGIDIEGRIGEAVLAAEAGKVTYAGSGIRGYGNLIIVQHAGGLISVYAHNSKLLAKEEQQVARGQKIAELGDSDTDQAKLHFEIRKQGKPLDPLKLLPPR